MRRAVKTPSRARAARDATRVTRRPGRPLDAARFPAAGHLGHDFGNVRVHTDEQTARDADALGVPAFTVGRDIAFASGAWRPGSTNGDRLLAHELAHVAQQAGANGPAQRVSTPAEEQDAEAAATAILAGRPYVPMAAPPSLAAKDGPTKIEIPLLDMLNPYGEASPETKKEIDEAKKALLAALDRYDSIDTLHQLRTMPAHVRLSLDGDAAFQAELRKRMWGKGLWIIQLHLRFGSKRPPHVHQLSLAMLSKDPRAVADLLRGFPDLTDPAKVPGVYEVLKHEFRDHPQRAYLLRLAREKVTATAREAYSYQEAHYEKPKGGGAWALQRFGGTARYDLSRTANELRIVVRIHLVEKKDRSRTWYPSDSKMKGWRDRIEKVWNNRFAAKNDARRLKIVFSPVFSPDNPHFTVAINPSKAYYRSDETEWWHDASDTTVAHEFGHMVGNPDEYRLPAKMSDIPKSMGMTAADKARSSVEGVKGKAPKDAPASGTSLGGVMGDPHNEKSRAERRHVWPILDRYNRTLKPATENDYVLVND